MASALRSDVKEGWSEHERSVYQLATSFEPPFYVKLIGGIYSDRDSECFSEDDEYVVLQKLQIKSVVTTVENKHQVKYKETTRLSIPLDYGGKFVVVNHTSSGHAWDQGLTLKEILSDRSNSLPLEVRLNGSRKDHGQTFLSKVQDSECTLTLLNQTTDEYFMAKSLDGGMIFIFSTESSLNFYVKMSTWDAVKNFEVKVNNLNYDIFVHNVGSPLVVSRNIEEVCASRSSVVPVPRRSAYPATKTVTPPPPIPPKSALVRGPAKIHSALAFSSKDHPENPLIRNTVNPPRTPPQKPSPKPPRKGVTRGTVALSYEVNMPITMATADVQLTDSDTRVTKEPVGLYPIGIGSKNSTFPLPPPNPPKPGPRIGLGVTRGTSEEYSDSDEEYNRELGAADVTGTTSTQGDIMSVSAVPPVSPVHQLKPRGYLQPPQDSSSGSDADEYEKISVSDDGSDYEPISDQPESSIQATFPTSSKQTKSKFDRLVKKVNVKFRKATGKDKKHDADFADDELTEDPYSEFHSGKKLPKKPYKRERNDPLPMPMGLGPSSSSAQPISQGHEVSRPPPYQTSSHADSYDDFDLSDYEQVDDNLHSSGSASIFSPFPNPPETSPRRPPLMLPIANSNPATAPQVQLDLHQSIPTNVGRVAPMPSQQNVIKNPNSEFPENVKNLSVSEVADTLRKLKIPEDVVNNFQEAQIDGDIFVCLTSEILDQLAVGPLHQLKIIKFKNGWRPKD